jgi:hypothetical protein
MGLIETLTKTFKPSGPGDKEPASQQIQGFTSGGRIPFDKILPKNDKIVYVDGWEKRGAPVMQPIANLWHWTAAKASLQIPAPCLNICTNGRAGIPGPLCHALIGYDGKIYIIASGRANHAGVGAQMVLAEMKRNEAPIATAAKRGLKNTGGSGGSLIGIEIEHPGDKTPLTQAQLDSIGLFAHSVAVYYKLGDNAAAAWTHTDWTSRKIDLDADKKAAIMAAFNHRKGKK